jgi:3-oxoacyl-[acyl-carrier-protein] synthase-3
MEAFIKHISYYLPAGRLSNDEIAYRFPEWDSEKIIQKIGVKNRNITKEDQFSSVILLQRLKRFVWNTQ